MKKLLTLYLILSILNIKPTFANEEKPLRLMINQSFNNFRNLMQVD